jgi:hypothetical protein
MRHPVQVYLNQERLIMFWAIALIGIGTTAPSVTYIGQFQEQAVCQAALQDLQKQQFKGTCVQIQQAPTTKK